MHLESANIPSFEPKPLTLPEAEFLSYEPDFARMKETWKQFGAFSNFLIIGNGGSVTSIQAMFGALGAQSHKKVFYLSTVDPDYIAEMKRALPEHETLVIAISKSGETITLLESLMHFTDYPLLVISGKGSALAQVGEKLKAAFVEHPSIGGRFTAFTEVALLPAMLAGLDVEAIFTGGRRMYEQYKQGNIAVKAAQAVYALEEKGIVDIFMPFYSHQAFALSNLIVQLCHESFGKDGKGQTYFAHEAPESQHHTNQRFFGGRKNIAGFFIQVGNFHHDQRTIVPTALHSIPLKDNSLFALNKIPLSYAMNAEFEGTWNDAKSKGLPLLALKLNGITPQEVGEAIAFWQLYAIYSSILRQVNPFDQPQVEASKQISWEKRLDYK